jgi:hypothetical protein
MTAVRLTPPFPLVVVGSPDYLRGRKRPERIDDLRGHACLRMAARTGQSRHGLLSTATRPSRPIVSGPLIAQDCRSEANFSNRDAGRS